ncbi:MAG: glycogen debranching protein GlgX [Alphaproteobacteria bacterium]|nr:glycogen debranching protein GlgX [Alphaproteobacteria bacterium]
MASKRATALGLGNAERLGAVADDEGVNFALFSAHASRIELCVFDAEGEHRYDLPGRTGDVWHGRLDGGGPGLAYGYRVHGPYEPEAGHRFNPHKLLVDPAARALSGSWRWDDRHCGYTPGDPREDLSFDTRDNGAVAIKSLVSSTPPPERSRHGVNSDVIYELHVRGMTMRHPDVPAPLRGCLEALQSPAVIAHLRALEVGFVEFLPITPAATSRRLKPFGLIDYWGYNPINFAAAEPRYLASGESGVRQTIAALADAGIGVILDLVFNHSGEDDELGPTISFRGIDNASYYRLATDPRRYEDLTGCRNTLDTSHPAVQRLILESLRHWAQMGVKGFRFDLAATLGRDSVGQFHADSGLLAAIRADPALASCQLIAEPWDAAPDGYQLGHFGAPWKEWNGRYRDCVRRFWRGDDGQVGELATRVSGSSDLFGPDAARSINFVTAHDGFSLADLVSYSRKHNDANAEHGYDGTDDNFSDNCGTEGPSADPAIEHMRLSRMKAFLATLMISRGAPMLRAGDELGHSQAGNNNAYAQDNAVSWLDWSSVQDALKEFAVTMSQLRRRYPALRGEGVPARWFTPSGREMSLADWQDGGDHSLVMLREAAAERFAIFFHSGREDQLFIVPQGHWLGVVSSRGVPPAQVRGGETVTVPAGSIIIFQEGA